MLSVSCARSPSEQSAPLISKRIINDYDIVFPSDAGVIDVTNYGAIPNDSKDDTIAIQQALKDHPTNNHIFYFPNGIYNISDTLTLAGSQKRNIFQGQSETKTILQLMDSVDSNFDKAIINFGPKPAQRFRNAIRDMTISVGSNHPKAIGVQFNASNQGTMENVTIMSKDLQGNIGLDMGYTDEIGPLLIKNLTVEGFDYGIKTTWQTASQTFENITLTNQNIYGWWNSKSQRIFARNIQSTNAVTTIVNNGEAGFVLVDSVIKGIDAASSVPAIINQKSMYINNTLTSGYSKALDSRVNWGRGNPDVPISTVKEYLANGSGKNRSGEAFKLFASPNHMLNLPVEETPEVPWEEDLKNWDGPHKHVIGTSGFPDDGLDDTPSIQAAIDAGESTIYLPRGTWHLKGTLELRNNVNRMIGTEARLIGSEKGVIRVVDGTAPIVKIERLEKLARIEHATNRTLVLNNLLGFSYLPTVKEPGNLFINDCTGKFTIFKNQKVWARQLNIEGDSQADPSIEAKILNDNAQVWILGLKTEDQGTVIKTINGGKTELLGTLHVGSGKSNKDNPRFVTEDASFSAAGVYGGGFTLLASEIRNGMMRTTDTFKNADSYIAYSSSK